MVVISVICQTLPVLSSGHVAGLHFLVPCDGVGPYDNDWPVSCELKGSVCVCVSVCGVCVINLQNSKTYAVNKCGIG